MSVPPPATGEPVVYVLGHSDRELARLSAQARVVDPITRRFLDAAGIGEGMRVLDVGSGAGDVALLAAELVGATGEVVGVDRSSAAVEAAAARGRVLARGNVSFREGDPAAMLFKQPFDAVIGRFVLQFQSDPAAMLLSLARHVRPGGVVVFHENDWQGVRSFPPVPTYDRCCAWIVETLRSSATEPHMGIKLHSTFVAAGLASPSLRLETVIGGGAHGSDALRLVADLAAILSPEMKRIGLTTAATLDADTLFSRMSEEARANASTIIGMLHIGAWSRV